MITALDAKLVVRIIAGLALLIGVFFVALSNPSGAWNLLFKVALISGFVSLIVIPLSSPKIFRWLHKWTGAKHWWFPLLDGVWEGQVHSNWSIVRAMMAASKGEREAFDPVNDTLSNDEWDEPVNVRMTISSTLLTVALKMEMLGTNRRSSSLVVKLDRDEHRAPRLRYLYRQEDSAFIQAFSDSDTHLGAGELVLTEDGQNLIGRYWTARMAERGLNTAGKLSLKRSSQLPP
mgnify:CR=1 FL=1